MRALLAQVSLTVLAGWLLLGCSTGGWVEEDMPEGAGPAPLALWVFAPRDVWLGGASIWHFNGDDWSETVPPVTGAIVKFWGFAPSDLWAISSTAAFHWDGSTWTEQSSGPSTGFNALSTIWGASSNDLWVANSDNSRVFHYDGDQWRRTVLQFVEAHALWGSSSSDIWLTGPFAPYHFDGIRWSPNESNDAPWGAIGLWGFDAANVWAAGGSAELNHFDGSTWVPENGVNGTYNAVWGSTRDTVYAVGSFGFFANYDGVSWHEAQILDATRNFTTIHGSAADDVWAAGFDTKAFSPFLVRKEP